MVAAAQEQERKHGSNSGEQPPQPLVGAPLLTQHGVDRHARRGLSGRGRLRGRRGRGDRMFDMRGDRFQLRQDAAHERGDAAQTERRQQAVVQVRSDRRQLMAEQRRQLSDAALSVEEMALQYAENGRADNARQCMRRLGRHAGLRGDSVAQAVDPAVRHALQQLPANAFELAQAGRAGEQLRQLFADVRVDFRRHDRREQRACAIQRGTLVHQCGDQCRRGCANDFIRCFSRQAEARRQLPHHAIRQRALNQLNYINTHRLVP